MDNVVAKLPPENIKPLRDSCLSISDGESEKPRVFMIPILGNSGKCDVAKYTLDDSFFSTKRAGDLERLDAFVLGSILSNEECDNLINASETVGLSYWDETRKKSRKIRECKTIECVLPEFTEAVWRRIENAFAGYEFNSRKLNTELHHSHFGIWIPYGFNPHVLISRYDPGDHFSPHIDGSCDIDINNRSFFSVIFYLNEVKSGGGTAFFDRTVSQQELLRNRAASITTATSSCIPMTTHSPKPGEALFFEHNLLHEGLQVENGSVKYIIRTDLMFERKEKIFQSPSDERALSMIKEAQRLESSGDTESSLRILMKIRHISPGVAEMFALT